MPGTFRIASDVSRASSWAMFWMIFDRSGPRKYSTAFAVPKVTVVVPGVGATALSIHSTATASWAGCISNVSFVAPNFAIGSLLILMLSPS